jgi:acid phosphatase family membrane protein YuiD
MKLLREAMDIPAVLGSILLALVAAQGMKLLLFKLRHHQRLHLEDAVVTGGMPSVHSATVTALCFSILWTQGWRDPTFALAVVLAVVVIRDALGVRRTAGEEGKTINIIIRLAHFKTPPVHYSLGHTPSEVAVGVVIGALIAITIVAVGFI